MELLNHNKMNYKSILLIIILYTCLKSISAEPPTKVIIGKQNQEINIVTDCEQYQLNTNYKEILINISNIRNLDSVMISDKPLADCGARECQADADICQIRSTDKNSEINFDTKMCIPTVFISVRRSSNPELDTNGLAKYSFGLSSDYVQGGSCSYIHENAFAYCGESSLEECRACNRPGCTVIQCGHESTEENSPNPNSLRFNKLYELCVPYTVTGEEKLNKCLSFKDVNAYRSTHECDYDDLEGYSSLTVFLLGVVVIIVLVFSLAVVYYNVYLIKYQTPPFYVPNYLPEFLFPRIGSQNTRISMDNRLDDVFASDNRQNF